jgi:hypothetical protein
MKKLLLLLPLLLILMSCKETVQQRDEKIKTVITNYLNTGLDKSDIVKTDSLQLQITDTLTGKRLRTIYSSILESGDFKSANKIKAFYTSTNIPDDLSGNDSDKIFGYYTLATYIIRTPSEINRFERGFIFSKNWEVVAGPD